MLAATGGMERTAATLQISSSCRSQLFDSFIVLKISIGEEDCKGMVGKLRRGVGGTEGVVVDEQFSEKNSEFVVLELS